jgi:hypothetical protein
MVTQHQLHGAFMADDGKFRRIRGALGNALVFAIGWTIAGFATWVVLRQARIIPPLSVIDGIGMSIRVGVMGFITGAAFPSIMRLAYRGKRLSEISWVRFGIVGGIVTGLFVPVFMQTMNVLSGDGMVPMSLIGDDILLATVFGAGMAALSLKLARYAEKRFPETFQDHADRLERKTRLTAGYSDIPATRRSRPAEVSESRRHDE